MISEALWDQLLVGYPSFLQDNDPQLFKGALEGDFGQQLEW